jgi:hypothetical protein
MAAIWATTVPALAKVLGVAEITVKRARAAGQIERTARGFHIEKCRTALLIRRSRAKAGTTTATADASGELSAEYSETLKRNVEQREELYEWDKRGRRAKALIAEVELAEKSKRVLPMMQVRKAWIANEMNWKESLKTIGRQLGGQWGGKLGKEIEAAALKLFAEMFRRMAGDPILSGDGKGPATTR